MGPTDEKTRDSGEPAVPSVEAKDMLAFLADGWKELDREFARSKAEKLLRTCFGSKENGGLLNEEVVVRVIPRCEGNLVVTNRWGAEQYRLLAVIKDLELQLGIEDTNQVGFSLEQRARNIVTKHGEGETLSEDSDLLSLLLDVYSDLSGNDKAVQLGEWLVEEVHDRPGSGTKVSLGGKVKHYTEDLLSAAAREVSDELYNGAEMQSVLEQIDTMGGLIGVTQLNVFGTKDGIRAITRILYVFHIVYILDATPSLEDCNLESAQGEVVVMNVNDYIRSKGLGAAMDVGEDSLKRVFSGQSMFVNRVYVDSKGIPIPEMPKEVMLFDG